MNKTETRKKRKAAPESTAQPKPPNKKAKAKKSELPKSGKASKKKKVDPSSDGSGSSGSEDEGSGVEVEEGVAVPSVVWDNESTQLLINHIIEDDNVKKGLYPEPGPNQSTVNGGGKKKTHWHMVLAKRLFEKHDKYKAAYAATVTNEKSDKQRLKAERLWGNRIKNRLARAETICTAHKKTMGQTGEGLKDADEITPNTDLANKWELVKQDCPWFFDMRDLLAQRPNRVPSGLGNSMSEVDMTVMDAPTAQEDGEADEDGALKGDGDDTDGMDVRASAGTSDDIGAWMDRGLDTSEGELGDFSAALEDAEEDVKPQSGDLDDGTKRKLKKGRSRPQRTDDEDAKEELDADVKPTTSSKKKALVKKSKMGELASVMEQEEVTAQKELELEKARIDAAKMIKLEQVQSRTARAQAKWAYKTEKMKAKQAKYQARASTAGPSNTAGYRHDEGFEGGYNDFVLPPP